MQNKRVMVTGGLGFIGSNFVETLIKSDWHVMTFDSLSYAANKSFLKRLSNTKKHQFFQGDIRNQFDVKKAFEEFKPNFIVNFAAETHVDRAISEPGLFCDVNFNGTLTLLEEIREQIINNKSHYFKKFVQISTDEVYGSRDVGNSASANSVLQPSNAYSASKASADLLTLSYHRTYGLPICVTRSCNNYGPNQNEEKLIPKIINALQNRSDIPIYGDGTQIRQWIHVQDHVEAILQVMLNGINGKIYNIGDENYISNIELAKKICYLYDKKIGLSDFQSQKLIKHVSDRPGHDKSYSICSNETRHSVLWSPNIQFDEGLKQII
jgi:dTDP-glucose 4,6-dehydratase